MSEVIDHKVAQLDPDLTEFEDRVLLLASFGGTTSEVAELLSVEETEVSNARDIIIEKFEVPNMAACVNQAIKLGRLAIEVEGHIAGLDQRRQRLLQLIAQGKNNRQIAQEFGKRNPKYIDTNWLQPLFNKMGANGRTHSVRRAYELSVFRTPPASLH